MHTARRVDRVALPLFERGGVVMVRLIRYRIDEAYAGSDHAKSAMPRLAYHAMIGRAIDAIRRLGREYREDSADDTSQVAVA